VPGRPAPTIRRYARQLNLPGGGRGGAAAGLLPTVCFNGACAMLLDGGGGRGGSNAFNADVLLYTRHLDLGTVSAVLAIAAVGRCKLKGPAFSV